MGKKSQLRDHDGGSPGSIVYISKDKTDKWSLLARGRGSRSCVLVALIICCVWKANCWSIRGLFDLSVFVSHDSHFFIIWLEIARWEGGLTGRESPGWGNSWFRTWALWRLSRGGNRRGSLGEGGWVYYYEYESMEVCLLWIDEAKANIKPIYECRCNERL